MKAKLLYHLRQMGLDLLVGVAIFLAPYLSSDDFSWSAHWWIVIAGATARRVLSIIVRYIIRMWGTGTSSD